jgi:alkylation response protein AidB-like acyl-CoA dehydrogenase
VSEIVVAEQERGRSDLAEWRRAAATNAFDADPFFAGLVRRLAGDSATALAQRLREVAGGAGESLDAAVRESNRDENLPVLRRHDELGRPREEVVFHPDYHEVGRVFWASGVLAALAEPGNEVEAGALAYLLDQHGEAGHACPVACTAGAIKLIQKLGTPAQKARYLPSLLSSDYDHRLHAAQFITEVQGGSDVGLNACVATPEPNRPGAFRIRGEKWFCSVADAGLFVVSARPEGAPDGTRGLGLFLVPRILDDAPNGFRLRRLKIKLGTRSMATGEIEFDGALGEAIGPLDGGFKNLVGIVLDTSRVHNALAACGMMRRAFVEARCFSGERRAFGAPIAVFPGVQQLLARMKLRTMAGLATTFRILALTDRIETGAGDTDLIAARRIAVMINKYWTAVACTANARDGIEVLGGNGTIEELSVLPRLYRDAIVVESWEGTHNTLCAQVLRDFTARELHRSWLVLLGDEIEALERAGHRSAARARALHAEVGARIARLVDADEITAAAHVRHVVDRMCRLSDWVALATQLAWEETRGDASDTTAALDLYALLWLDAVDPQEATGLIELQRVLGKAP